MVYRQRAWVLIYFSPALLITIIFIMYPIIQSVHYSFLNWNLLSGNPKWAGLANYYHLVHDQYFHIALKNSLIYIIGSIIFQLGSALLLATLIYNKVKGSMFFRTVYFTPAVLSTVAVALMFLMIYDPNYGLLNTALRIVGLSSWKHDWLANPKNAFYFAMIPKMWQFTGLYVVILFTGLSNIPIEMYEAADIDGASGWQKFIHITVPMLRDVLGMAVTLISIETWKSFVEIWVLTQGGPAHSTEIVGTYLVKETFTTFDYGYGSSISVVVLLIGIFLVLGLRYIFLHFKRS